MMRIYNCVYAYAFGIRYNKWSEGRRYARARSKKWGLRSAAIGTSSSSATWTRAQNPRRLGSVKHAQIRRPAAHVVTPPPDPTVLLPISADQESCPSRFRDQVLVSSRNTSSITQVKRTATLFSKMSEIRFDGKTVVGTKIKLSVHETAMLTMHSDRRRWRTWQGILVILWESRSERYCALPL